MQRFQPKQCSSVIIRQLIQRPGKNRYEKENAMIKSANSYKENMIKRLDKICLNPYNEHRSSWEVL